MPLMYHCNPFITCSISLTQPDRMHDAPDVSLQPIHDLQHLLLFSLTGCMMPLMYHCNPSLHATFSVIQPGWMHNALDTSLEPIHYVQYLPQFSMAGCMMPLVYHCYQSLHCSVLVIGNKKNPLKVECWSECSLYVML
ncbi:hypothetical protein HOLleu_39599 [Holothuria leucospilota]|uniref:Uncharacterized protein n=1 Tax=Holothuria leucospilota TaxID=206669 RepID=A0A9Q0YIU0_HOLLE|nr:hypothetical protein HOLleu_39599 [Holothuria leucospilota]